MANVRISNLAVTAAAPAGDDFLAIDGATNGTRKLAASYFSTGSSGPGGGVTASGTPTNGQAAEWVSSSAIQGVSVTGTGNYVKSASPTFTGTPLSTTAAAGTSTTQIATTAFVTGAIREKLAADRTYYVSTTGSNSNNGLTVGAPFLTIAKAMSVIATIDFNGFIITVQLADGTYNELVIIPRTVGQKDRASLILRGNSTTPTNVVVRNANSFQPAVEAPFGAGVTVGFFRVTAPNNGYGLNASEGGVIDVGSGMDFGDCTGQYHMYANNGGVINCFASYTISGPAGAHWAAAFGGAIFAATTVNANGAAIAFSNAFAYAQNDGSMQVNGCTFSNVGSVTGKRFSADSNGSIQTYGSGATYLPGNAAGTVSNGGVYDSTVDYYKVGGALGTPSSATLTNATGLPLTGLLQTGATTGQGIIWNGSQWAPGSVSAGSTFSAINFNGTASPTYGLYKLVADTTNDSLTFFNSDSNVSLQIGQEEWIRVVNNTGVTIANGAAVYINGSSGGMPTIALAQANAGATTVCCGLATEAIANGATGFVTCLGLVRGVDTSAFSVGAVYVSAVTPGALTQTAPTSPNYRYRVGFVTSVNATTGSIHVTPSTASLGNGTANQVLGINPAGTAQEFKTFIAGANISISAGSGSYTFSASAGSGGGGSGTKTIAVLIPQNNEPPATNYATFSTRNSHPYFAFDDTTQEASIWSWRVPEGAVLTSGLSVFVQWAAVATSGTVGWDVAFERIDAGGLDIDADNFGSAQTITAATVNATSGITSVTSVSFSQAQLPTSLAPGDMYRIRIRRDVALDTAVGDAQLLQAEIRLN